MATPGEAATLLGGTVADDQPGNPKLRRALRLVEGIDPAKLGKDDDLLLQKLEAGIRRLKGAASFLKARKVAA
jgi:hypothetical protein